MQLCLRRPAFLTQRYLKGLNYKHISSCQTGLDGGSLSPISAVFALTTIPAAAEWAVLFTSCCFLLCKFNVSVMTKVREVYLLLCGSVTKVRKKSDVFKKRLSLLRPSHCKIVRRRQSCSVYFYGPATMIIMECRTLCCHCGVERPADTSTSGLHNNT